ncbi:MAG TPA: hypothetical protein VK901_09410 [Nitrospiraceae bacterium]|nr:hypothetical protein [Nitrospiraceae bacterium]
MNIRRPLWFLVVIAMAGCAHIGPGNMSRDRFDYSGTVAESWKTQMLLNLVKLRYGDTPVFLDVGQIVANYSFQRTLTAAGNANIFNSGTIPGVISGNFGMGAQGVLTDTPTITYAPLAGERFARSMMMPLPVSAVLNILQGGYPVDFVFRLAVQSVNGVDNRRVQLQHVRPANPEFYALLRELNRVQASGEVGVRIEKDTSEERLQLIFRPRIAAAVAESLRNIKNILGLDPDTQAFRVTYGVVPANDKEIAFLTRSILEVLTDLSSRIKVPEAHVTEHRVGPTPEADLGQEGPIPDLIRITSSADSPDKAFVTAPYRGYWFSIDDQDLRSKRLFTFLMFLFTFVETPGSGAPPILTIPASR